MSSNSKEVNNNKENEGGASAKSSSQPNKNVVIYATDMTKEMREKIITAATKAFSSPVNKGKVYQTIADLIRTECEKECEEANKKGGWSCVVGDMFGSSVTHRMKTYIHFSVTPNVNILLWKS